MLNKIMLIGNLGKDPEMTYTQSGLPVTKFSLAVSRNTKNPSGERQEETDWFNVVAWRGLAETCFKFLHKGSKVYIEGRLSQRKYTDKEGQQRTAIEVIANDMEMLSPKSAQGSSESSGGSMNDDFSLDDSDEFP
ncbi:MAG TPA: single-stranded DNA-binding protein [Ktedonobacteraceae bacterium]|nr:single-stranded DNA-binding protein [Ktedonobacteraceae bacterium]